MEYENLGKAGTMNAVKALVRLFILAISALPLLIVGLTVAPVIVIAGLSRLQRRLALWAIYDEDEQAMEKDEWRSS